MPVLRPPARVLINNARFTAADLVALRQAIRSRTATVEDAKTIATQYADTLEAGVGNQLRELLQSLGSSTAIAAPIANLAQEQGLLTGQVILPDSGQRHASVRSVQRALIALANRTQQVAYMLPQGGADGVYGNETTLAVRAFQQRNGLPVTGKVNPATAKAIDQALRNTQVPGIMTASPADLVQAAKELCTGSVALNYGVPQPWINIDPNHNVPVDRPFMLLVNRWKCNLFGGNVLRKGGYEPPYYGNQGKGEYPNANQWFKWSDKHAPRFGNRVHFQLIAEVAPASMEWEASKRAIADLLAKAKPGDFLLQDHPGSQVADGGHTRVAIATQFTTNGTVSFAQAQFDQAGIQQEGVDDLTGSENLWLLRPNLRM
ncbi:peptidoglycan-binding protein [Oscillatoria sp. FACHB-1407]|uniref:peptidoglycan-binding domain-containing protein n=1 Tax=Oscillatoria sp. FACHB-1407 TaxID=2692847 RepID=UPI001689A210|nr:peptidoglycan-binding domain-containing protein [Oscillatoria sp. FACHB-1407]MBD2465015.1 peptidoglycan-binding protein [Oscillatoria sp. FACHB-1407]